MIKTTEDAIYNSIKNKIGFYRSKKILKWVHESYPGCVAHHVFGSVSQSLKTSDYCLLPLSTDEHGKAEKDKSGYAIEHLADMINLMQKYIIHLENKK